MSSKDEGTRIPGFILNTVESLVKHSLLITAGGMLIASLSSSSPMKGIMFVVITFLAIFARIGFLMLTSYTGPENLSKDCNGDLPGNLAYYDGGRNNLFVLSMTLFYIALPMLLANHANWYLIFMMVVQLSLTCFVVHGKRCISNYVVYLLEITGGAFYGSVASVVMYYGGLRSWLMISGIPGEIGSHEVKQQNLKCVIRQFVPSVPSSSVPR